MTLPRLALTFLIVIVLFALPTLADELQWKVGLASLKITPEKPVQMAGYANRVRPFEKVEQDIYAKALAIEDQGGHRAVLITMDLIGLSADLAEPVAQRIAEKTKVQRPDILLSYAHNHAGPQLSVTAKPGVGVSAEDAANTVAYTRRLQDQLVDLAVQATSADLKPAAMSWSTGVANFPMNRREFTPGGVILGRNPRGPADRAVPVLRIEGAAADHKPLAIVFGCACHNTTLTGQNYAICGDYAGFAQHEIQAALPQTQAMFVTGCAGDADPYPRGKMEDARRNGHDLAAEVLRVAASDNKQLKPVNGPLRTAFDQAELPLKPMKRDELQAIVTAKKPGYLLPTATRMLEMLDKGEPLPTSHRAPLAVWQFGKDLTLVALSGEVVVDYAFLVEQSIGPLNLWPAAYCNDYFGYLPSKRVISEGGYETRGLHDGTGFFAPEAEQAFVNKVHELAEKAGREMPAK
jgi:neutral ceramidase